MTNALFVAAFDSQLKWCVGIREELERRGVTCRIVVPTVRNALSQQQIEESGIGRVERVSWDEMIEAALSGDLLISALSGPNTKRISIELARHTKATGSLPPVVVSGWVGVIIEKLVAGYLDRCGCDVVAVNSKADWDRFHLVAERLGIPTANMVLSGLPFVPNMVKPQRSGGIRTVLFADQPTVPESPQERLYIYRRLIRYAQKHPERTVLLKPRHRPGEGTFHRMDFHPGDLLKKDVLPPNFVIDYTPISEQLQKVDLMLTMSSTAAIEAVADGCRAALILDLGVHEKYGNPVFLESGLLRTFDAIEADDIGAPTETWMSDFFPQLDARPATIIADRALDLLERQERPSLSVFETDYFVGASESHYETVAIAAELKASKRYFRKPSSYQDRLKTYNPMKRAFVKFWEYVLPDPVASFLYARLKSVGLL